MERSIRKEKDDMKRGLALFLVFVMTFMSMFTVSFADTNQTEADFYQECEEITDEILEDGVLKLYAAPAEEEMEFYFLLEPIMVNAQEGRESYVMIEPANEDYTLCDITIALDSWDEELDDSVYFEETYDGIPVEYIYDEGIKANADQYTVNIPETKEFFKVEDLDIVNYWMHSSLLPEETASNVLANYSGELKELLEYCNYDFDVDNRAGSDYAFFTERRGIAKLSYEDVVYYLNPELGVKAEHIIYVDDETEDTPEALRDAAQARIDEYLGEGNVEISINEELTLSQYFIDEDAAMVEARKDEPDPSFLEHDRELFAQKNAFLFALRDDGVETVFKATVNGREHDLLILRDSAKMVTPTFRTADIETAIEIETEDSAVPLDAWIRAERMEAGDEYERIMETLQLRDCLTFDLNLYSETFGGNVTKLDNDEFEVRIPISGTELEDQELKAYFVDDEGNVETYDVEKRGRFAVFYTSHFSAYTLAGDEKIVDAEDEQENEKKPEGAPATGDNGGLLVMLLISGLSAFAMMKMRRKAQE